MSQIPRPNPKDAEDYFKRKLDCSSGPIEVSGWLKEKAPITLVDVRRKEDYEKGHLPGAISLPKGSWEQVKGLSKDKTTVVYCYSQQCHLAAGAAYEFAKQGYPVIEMEGGFNSWKRAQLEITSAAPAAV